MGLSDSTNADSDVVTLDLPTSGLRVDSMEEYSFSSHFLTPSDGFTMKVGDEAISDKLIAATSPGQRFTATINGHVNVDGYIDSQDAQTDRHGGSSLHVDGLDRLGYAVGGCIDPSVRFSADMTLFDLVKATFGPFGWPNDSQYLISNEANRNVITGAVRGVPTTKGGKKSGPKELKSFAIHQLKPYTHEGAFEFAARVCERFGLWIWLSAEGNFIIVGKPEFDQEARYSLIRKRGQGAASKNNILSGGRKLDGTHQPSVIIATGHGSGAEFAHSQLKVLCVNPSLDQTAQLAAIRSAHPDAFIVHPFVDNTGVQIDRPLTTLTLPVCRPLFLHDDESKTQDQLVNFTRKEMSLRMRKYFTAKYVVEGHTNNGQNWCVDCIVNVDDDYANVHEPLWVLSRTFTKSKHGGTHTHLELIRPGTLSF